MKASILGGTLAAVAAMVAIAAPAPQASAAEFRLGIITPPSHVWTRAGERFAEEIEAASDGEVTVSVFPGGQLGSESDMFQQLQSGVLDMAWLTAAVVSNRLPSYFGWFSPFLMDDVAMAAEAAETEAARDMLVQLDDIGIRGQGYTFAGMRHILMRGEPAREAADLENQKMRIYPFPAMETWWSTNGASPTPVRLTEIYQSLESGLLDGVDIDYDALVGLSMQEVAEGLTVTNHMAWPMVAMISPEAWDTLSPDQQETFTDVLDETLAWATEQQIEAEARHLDQLKGEIDVVELEDAESNFEAGNQAFQDEFGSDETIAAFQEQVRALRD